MNRLELRELSVDEMLATTGGDWYCFAYGAIATGAFLAGQYWGTAAAILAATKHGCFD